MTIQKNQNLNYLIWDGVRVLISFITFKVHKVLKREKSIQAIETIITSKLIRSKDYGNIVHEMLLAPPYFFDISSERMHSGS